MGWGVNGRKEEIVNVDMVKFFSDFSYEGKVVGLGEWMFILIFGRDGVYLYFGINKLEERGWKKLEIGWEYLMGREVWVGMKLKDRIVVKSKGFGISLI